MLVNFQHLFGMLYCNQSLFDMTLKRFFSILVVLFTLAVVATNIPHHQHIKIAKPKEQPVMILLDSCTTATIYHATPKECDNDCAHPANPRFTIDLTKPEAHRIIAMERTFRQKLNLQWGDLVYIEGTDHDGYWQVQDAMNSRFKNQSRIDLLVANEIKYGLWRNVKLYKVQCSDTLYAEIYEKHMLGSL